MAHIVAFIDQIDDLTQAHDTKVTNDADLVLELLPGQDGQMACGYYFAEHQTRCLFWLEQFDISCLIAEVKGATSPAHISTVFYVLLG